MTDPRLAALLCLILLGASAPARAQFFMDGMGVPGGSENIEGFTVAGKGSVQAKPNAVEIDLEVSAASELTADAIVKYRDARRRLQDAFAALKLANVSVEERGLLVDQKGMMMPYYWGGFQQNTRNKTEVQLSRKLVVRATDIRKMEEDALLQLVAKLLDVAQDAGAQVGRKNEYNPYYYNPYEQMNRGGLVRFIVDDFDKLEEEAYEKAIADARSRAKRMARLSGVELGPVVAVRELIIPGERRGMMNTEEETPRKRLETAKYQEVPVRVELLVRYEIHPTTKGKERADNR